MAMMCTRLGQSGMAQIVFLFAHSIALSNVRAPSGGTCCSVARTRTTSSNVHCEGTTAIELGKYRSQILTKSYTYLKGYLRVGRGDQDCLVDAYPRDDNEARRLAEVGLQLVVANYPLVPANESQTSFSVQTDHQWRIGACCVQPKSEGTNPDMIAPALWRKSR